MKEVRLVERFNFRVRREREVERKEARNRDNTWSNQRFFAPLEIHRD